MQSERFLEWLMAFKKHQENTAKSRVSNCERICRYYGDIDIQYKKDKCSYLLDCFTYTKYDENSNHKAKHIIPIYGNVYNGTATLKQALNLYIQFLESN